MTDGKTFSFPAVPAKLTEIPTPNVAPSYTVARGMRGPVSTDMPTEVQRYCERAATFQEMQSLAQMAMTQAQVAEMLGPALQAMADDYFRSALAGQFAQTVMNAPFNGTAVNAPFNGTYNNPDYYLKSNEARQKALGLLQKLLSAAQWETYTKDGRFVVEKDGKRYELGGTQVVVLDDKGERVENWCVYCPEGPWEDTVIAHYLHLTHSPEELRARANVTYYQGRDGYTLPRQDGGFTRRVVDERARHLLQRAGYLP